MFTILLGTQDPLVAKAWAFAAAAACGLLGYVLGRGARRQMPARFYQGEVPEVTAAPMASRRLQKITKAPKFWLSSLIVGLLVLPTAGQARARWARCYQPASCSRQAVAASCYQPSRVDQRYVAPAGETGQCRSWAQPAPAPLYNPYQQPAASCRAERSPWTTTGYFSPYASNQRAAQSAAAQAGCQSRFVRRPYVFCGR